MNFAPFELLCRGSMELEVVFIKEIKNFPCQKKLSENCQNAPESCFYGISNLTQTVLSWNKCKQSSALRVSGTLWEPDFCSTYAEFPAKRRREIWHLPGLSCMENGFIRLLVALLHTNLKERMNSAFFFALLTSEKAYSQYEEMQPLPFLEPPERSDRSDRPCAFSLWR